MFFLYACSLPLMCLPAASVAGIVKPRDASFDRIKQQTQTAIVTSVQCDGDCPSEPFPFDGCDNKCGCDRAYYYNETTGDCVLSPETRILLVEKYNTQENIRLQAERVFARIIGSAILFVTCAVAYIFAACYYCCRMKNSDRKLKRKVKALVKKHGRILPPKKGVQPTPKYPLVADSCNIIVEDAGICVM